MGKDCAVRIPTDVTVETIALSVEREVALAPGSGETVYAKSLEISPISLTYVGEKAGDIEIPALYFRRTDGSVVTQTQLGLSFQRTDSPQGAAYPTLIYRTDTPMELEEFTAVILGDTEFPLDGSEPFPAEVDETLVPFELDLLRYRLSEDEVRNYVADVAELCRNLGAEYSWDEETGTASASYRGETITLTAGSSTVLVDGEPVELWTDCVREDGSEQRVELPVLEENGILSAYIDAFDSWDLGLDVNAERENGEIVAYTFTVTP